MAVIERQINTRVQLKIDTTANWNKATSFIPKKGEPIIYKDSGAAPKIKIGDGSTKVTSLPFLEDKTGGIACADSSSNGNVVITTI